ncbi:hypothetical protein CDAR_383161 [Caerostris darwini]|uniref:Uncharacterized protein n=1 Tax=Caerostris darwini TaxID=1538125 RepID=A0AAV4NWX4_9ARAC|nr:hypothetical protein CDAR_383161 [Caerostris darwini]
MEGGRHYLSKKGCPHPPHPWPLSVIGRGGEDLSLPPFVWVGMDWSVVLELEMARGFFGNICGRLELVLIRFRHSRSSISVWYAHTKPMTAPTDNGIWKVDATI